MIRRATRGALTASLLLAASLSLAAAGPAGFDGTIEGARLIGTLRLEGEVFHVQGLELGQRHIWVTSVDQARRRGYLHVFDRRTGGFVRRIALTDGARYHPGGLSFADGAIWVPVAEYRPDSSTTLFEIDAERLTVRRRIRVADHLGFVAAARDVLVAGTWDSRALHIIDLRDRTRDRVVPNPSETRYQDMKFADGRLVAGGHRSPWSGTVDWIDWPALRVVRTRRAGAIGPIRPFGRGGPYTGEGMAIAGRDLYLIPEDGPTRLFRFRLED